MSDTPKSYGQVAYEAYCNHTGWKSLISGAALPQWADLKPEIKAAWESSAKAVIAEFVRRVTGEATSKSPSPIGYGESDLWEAFHKLAKEVES